MTALQEQTMQAQIDELRAELAELRASLAREVRTERLAVVHPDDGRELLYTRVHPDAISLAVNWNANDDGFPYVVLSSSDEIVGGFAGLAVVTAGDCVVDIDGRRTTTDAPLHRIVGTGSVDVQRREYETGRAASCTTTRLSMQPEGVEIHSGSITAAARFEVSP